MMFRRPQPRLVVAEPMVDLSPAEVHPDTRPMMQADIVDRGRALATKLLSDLRREEIGLEADIADKSERLRQTRLTIKAFERAEATLNGADTEDHVPANDTQPTLHEVDGAA